MTSAAEVFLSNEIIYSPRKDKNYETYSLVWLDASVNSDENRDVQERIRLSINYLLVFEKLNECETYIQSATSEDRIIVIISGHFGQDLVPKIHQLRQVFSIHIYCQNKEFHQQWSERYNKVKGVHNELNDLISQIQSDQSRRRQSRSDEPFVMLTLKSESNDEQSTMDLNGRFLQYQLLLSCLSKMQTSDEDKEEFVSRCRQHYKGNAKQLKDVDEFQQEYEAEHALWWYTTEKFLYRLLNKALRIQDIDLLFLIRFFIRDIEQELHQRRHSSIIHVYRGQIISSEELNLLKNSQGQFISINSFLSTSINPNVALMYTHIDESGNDSTLERILFEIDADPKQNSVKPFADISQISKFSEEQEILMMAGSVFRLEEIFRDKNQIWHVHMTLCGEKDYGLHTTFDQMRNQYGPTNTGSLFFANVLIDMAHFDTAEKYLSRLLKQIPSDHKDLFKCYQALGKVLCEKGCYELSHYYLQKALEFLQKFPANDSRIAYIYNNIGEVYQNEKKYEQAFQCYEEALNIFQQHFTDEDQNVAWCYNNLGTIYEKLKNYSKAFEHLSKALEIKSKSLPKDHPCMSNTYNNIGNVYYYRKEYDQALESYQLSLEIFRKTLNAHHPSIARVLKNIGLVHEAKKDFIEAKKIYDKVWDMRERILSSSHPDLMETNEDIARMLLKIKSEAKLA